MCGIWQHQERVVIVNSDNSTQMSLILLQFSDGAVTCCDGACVS